MSQQSEQSASRKVADSQREIDSTRRNPGDVAAPGTPGTGEDFCPVCLGSGQRGGRACHKCGGTGRIVEGIGGG